LAATPGPGIELSELIEALSAPAAYPHPVRGLRVIQTHISCVFLTGERVYKVKKPVDFGFLDYSTLERRRAFCEREVELNRRLCPDVYLDTVPLVRTGEGIRIGGEGEAVEWAVRMVQLPEEELLSARLAAGTVGVPEIERAADRLAAFHGGAAGGPGLAPFGSPGAVWRSVGGNFAVTAPRVGAVLPLEHLRAIEAWSRTYLESHREQFLARVNGDRIRDGHGDLRAQNICLAPGFSGGVQFLDCIEFDDRYRCTDVAADVAYLAMDLDFAGRADLRRALLKRYVEVSGDDGLLSLQRFYCCYRAFVRGKIALLASEEQEVPPADREEHAALGAAAFDLSLSYARRRERPALFITVGFSGSGKSTLARELARRLPAVRLASDEVRKELAGVPAGTTLPADQYGDAARSTIYGELVRRAMRLLEAREHVILDATFLSARHREQAAQLARLAEAELWCVECSCPAEVIRQRLTSRAVAGADASDAALTVYETQIRERGEAPFTTPAGAVWVPVRTDQPPGTAAREALGPFWRGELGR
jgi:aminoglycoside phosphotransferase family enzyme/predicted kinase